jgi:hypothetical protein
MIVLSEQELCTIGMDLNMLSEIDLNELTAQTAESSIDEKG